jgi:hypothetical protein
LRPYGDLDRYWTGYLELEREFSEFTTYVPLLRENSDVISPRLANLVSLCGNWIETIYKRRMLESPWPFTDVPCVQPSDIKNIHEFRNTFEGPYRLSKQVVFVKRYLTEFYRRVLPFESFASAERPEWFADYSALKHNRPELQKRMTLWKTTEALAGLFLLSVYPYEMREYLVDIGVIRSTNTRTNVSLLGTEADLKLFLMSHPFLLNYGNQGHWGLTLFGPVIAESQMFSFEFPQAVGPNNQMEKEGYLESLWKASESRR